MVQYNDFLHSIAPKVICVIRGGTKIILVGILGLTIGCHPEKKKSENLSELRMDTNSSVEIDSSEMEETNPSIILVEPDTIPYLEAIAKIREQRTKLKRDYTAEKISMDSVSRVFTKNLVNTLIPYWYGTPWSFEGHTSVPKKGEVACGYFVSTTLRDMGLKLNRYKLAQKSPIDEAKVISCGTEIFIVEDINPQLAMTKIDKTTSEGLYFIGYDSGHVGYLLKEDGSLFLIHSNYMSPFSVSIEPFSESRVFQSFSKFYLVDVTHNEELLKKWLNNRIIL